MQNIVYGGKNIYGFDIGVLMLESRFPRIPGDVGNATTFDFPVLYKVVKGGTPSKVVLELTKADIAPFIEAAKELEREGVSAITTSCGFLALFQNEIAEELSIPVFTSALIMLPIISKMIGKNKKVLVLTANSNTLSKEHLVSVCGNIDDIPMKIVGTQDRENFTDFTVQNWMSVDTKKCENEILETIESALSPEENIGAILLECTNMPPYAETIRKKFNLPVFDFVSLTNFVYHSLKGKY